ncbi:MAG: hypothetical protein ACYC0X_12415 [Pirellulaceae bacterium]
MVVARQKLSVLLMPLGGGVILFSLAVSIPWLIKPFCGWILLLSVWFCLGGVLFAFAGWRSWQPQGIGLMLDKHGLWWKYDFTFAWWRHELLLVRWDQIIGVQLVQWIEQGDEEYGLVVGLRDNGPLGLAETALIAEDVRKRFAFVPWDRTILLHDENWMWEPQSVMAYIQQALSDPTIWESW